MDDNLVYTAPWILPASSPGIKEGAIVANSNRIVAVGSQKKIFQDYPNCRVIDLSGAIIPPLVNCHIHLELSYLQDAKRPELGDTMVDWIESLLHKRQVFHNNDIIVKAMKDTMRDQFNSGVILMADIGNTSEKSINITDNYPEIISILELLAPTQQRTSRAIDDLVKIDDNQLVSPHAPYSTSANLIATLKKRATKNKHIFTIHLAESLDEIECICNRQGAFRRFLEKRESWEEEMLGEGRYIGAVDYLNSLGVLDHKTLCVHCVHVEDEEIMLLAEKRAKVCLCPGSNEFLRVGRAPLEKLLHQKILPAIGTDSYASNELLDMWREMQILCTNHPNVHPGKILAMATLGGAAALHRADDYGTLEPGKKSIFLEIQIERAEKLKEIDLLKILTQNGRPASINWVGTTEN